MGYRPIENYGVIGDLHTIALVGMHACIRRRRKVRLHLACGHEEFEEKIIGRMGRTFYRRVFQRAIRHAWDEKKGYEEIRDRLRKTVERSYRDQEECKA